MGIPTAENKILVRRFKEAMNTRQLDALDEVVAPNFVRHCQATPNLDVRSLEQFKDFLRQDAAVFPDNTQTFTHVIAEGDTVAVWATYEGTQRGKWGRFRLRVERCGSISQQYYAWRMASSRSYG